MGFIALHASQRVRWAALALGLSFVLSGCPEAVPVESETVSVPPSEIVTPEPLSTDAETAGEDAVANENAVVNPDVIWTDPIDWFLYRLFSRRFYRSGEEFTASPDGDAAGESTYQPTTKELRRFTARPLFKLFATNVQKHETAQGNGQGNGALHRLLNAIFRFRHEGFEISKVLVRIDSVEVRQGSVWTTVMDFGDEGRLFDFVALHEGGILELGEFPIAPGHYTRMRLNLGDGNKIVVDEGSGEVERQLVVPFFQTRKIELVRAFDVTSSGLSSIRVDFDLEQSVSRGLFHSYWLTPVMRIVGVESGTPSTSLISADAGGVIEIMNEISVVIPPGALTDDTQVTIRPALQLLPHASPDLVILGQEYVLEPEGLELNVPAQVVVRYRSEHLQALNLAAPSLDLYTRQSMSPLWSSSGSVLAETEQRLTAEIVTFGRMVLGAKSLDVDMSQGGGCVAYGDQVAPSPAAVGFDPQNFYGTCRRQQDCYDHGGRTYGKSADQCLDEFFSSAQARCERLCEAAFGVGCSEVSAADQAMPLYADLIGPLRESCLVVSGRMYGQRLAAKTSEYPAPELQTCEDYAGLGVSCETPVCTLDVDQAAIPIDTPTDLTFNLSYAGSITTVDFDGSVVFQQEGIALPVEDTVTVFEEGRSLSAAKTFTATVRGPAAEAAECSVTVDVIQEPDPCSIVITPDVTPAGLQVNLFVTVLPGYNTALMDIRTEGVMNPVGLSTPDANGTRYFSTNTRPSGTRSYTATVTHDDGDEFSCSANVTVQ